MATLKIKRSNTAGAVPASLVDGEIAINQADGVIYYRDSGGVVRSFKAGAPLDSPAFTGTPTAPTQSAGDNSTRLATTAFVQQNTPSSTSVAASINGLTISNHSTNPTTHINIGPGTARDNANKVDITLAAGITKRLNAVWAAGTNNGGLDTGAMTSPSHYHIFLIRNPTTAAVDVLLSQSPTSPVMPSGFTQKRRIGALATGFNNTTSAHEILQARWYGGDVKLKNPAFTWQASASIASPTLYDVFVPKGVKMKARFYAFVQQPSAVAGHVVLSDPDAGAVVAGANNIPGLAKFLRAGASAAQQVEEWTDTNGRLYCFDSSGSGAVLTIWPAGWYDERDEFA